MAESSDRIHDVENKMFFLNLTSNAARQHIRNYNTIHSVHNLFYSIPSTSGGAKEGSIFKNRTKLSFASRTANL